MCLIKPSLNADILVRNINYHHNFIVRFFLLQEPVRSQGGGYPNEFALERPPSLPAISQLEVMCGKEQMTVQLVFTSPFQGMVFSKGQYGQNRCMYVQPRSGGTQFEFQILYNDCGTKPDMGGKFYENTIIVQYDSDLIEVWDEAKRLRCEWYNDYEKTASKPPMVIADLEVVELNFRGDNVDCWMEIQDGKGPWASPVTGIVPLGSTLTAVVAINDLAGEFDMRVKSCEASDGINAPIYLSDAHGCVLRPKMISKFMKLRNNDGRATVITYAHFHAFKFPDSMAVHIRCKVEICRYGCPDHCQKPTAGNPIGDYSALVQPQPQPPPDTYAAPSETNSHFASERRDGPSRLTHDPKLDEVPYPQDPAHPSKDSIKGPLFIANNQEAQVYLQHQSANSGEDDQEMIELPHKSDFPWGPRHLRRRRRYAVHDRQVRSADIGVTTDIQVISEADLEFTPTKDEGVTVFKGHPEEVVYGVCLPAPGFSALFVLLAMCTVISVLVAGFMCHHRQLQKDTTESPATPHPLHTAVAQQQQQAFNMVHFLRAHLVQAVH
ncbi:uncharacterized protein LOC143037670 [Oratosquilla oratoria]|uniref:uncharacterized protein LOC143037670 n=1 Tax=Oratosquilla oratoria TaxID=337810 RepID=UPI003F75C4D6